MRAKNSINQILQSMSSLTREVVLRTELYLNSRSKLLKWKIGFYLAQTFQFA